MITTKKSLPSPAALLALAVAIGGVIYLYAAVPITVAYGGSSLLSNVLALWKREEWQHCWLVPLAIVAIVWMQRKDLLGIEVKGSGWGALVVGLGLMAFWLSFRLDDVYIGFISLQILIGGLVLWFGGVAYMRALIFPWLFLWFAWPFTFLDNVVAFPLRMVMSKASFGVLHALGVPVILQGTGILSAPNPSLGIPGGKLFSVDVADPCSGIRSLFALMMVSALYGFFTLKEWWQKWVLFLCSIPLAVLGNLIRILMLTFGTIALGADVAIGTLEKPTFFHMMAGYVVFAVALGGMLGIGWVLNWVRDRLVSGRGFWGSGSGAGGLKGMSPVTASGPAVSGGKRQRPEDPY